VILKPIDFVANIFYLNGVPIRFPKESMRHLYTIYNSNSRAKLFKFARQTHKSTTIACELTYPCVKYPSFHSLYVAPTGTQVSVFSTDKLDSCMRGSVIIQTYYTDSKTKDQIFYKEFSNQSKIYLRSAFYSADSIRGPSTDKICIDEVQDIVSDHIPVIEQSMSHSMAHWESLKDVYPNIPPHLFNSKIYAGTPKTVENTLEKLWSVSTQCEWIVKCQHCNRYNYINENNVGDICLICNKCGKPIYYEFGNWVSINSTGIIDGYRMPQIVLNWINNRNNPDAWKINVINTRKVYSSERFFNEVLALPYASAKHPIGILDLKACCEDYDMSPEELKRELEGIPLCAGIDWGKGDTASGTSYSVLTIGGYIKNKHRTIFIKKYEGRMSDAVLQLEDMLRIIIRLKCVLTIADTGDGRTSNAIMVNKLSANRFAEIYEHGTISQKIKWNGDKGHYIMNRTRMMTDIIMEIKRCQVAFFKYEQFEKYTPDFTGIYIHYSERTRMTIYDHNVPDDCFHSYMFSRIASMIIRGELSQYLNAGK